MTSQPSNRPADDSANPQNKRGDTPPRGAKTATIGGARITLTDEGITIEADEEEIDELAELAQNIFGAFTDESDSNRAPPAPAFYIYENRPANRARVHKADCGLCNHGEGRRNRRKPKSPAANVRWHGPCDTRESAFSTMAKLGKKDAGACSVCKP